MVSVQFILVQVVLQHGDLHVGGGGDDVATLGGGEEMPAGDDEGRAAPVSLLVSEGDQPGRLTWLAGSEMSSVSSLTSPTNTTNLP